MAPSGPPRPGLLRSPHDMNPWPLSCHQRGLMQQHIENHRRPRIAASAAFFNTKQALITAAILIGSVLGVCEMAWAQGQPIIFSVIGDVPYSTGEKADFQQHMNNHDLYSPSEFLAHIGDIKSGGGSCVESWYRDMATSLRSLSVPAFIVPGDNEWNDCSNPTQAWAYWVTHLLAVEQNACGVPLVTRQIVRPENFAFVKNGVLFIGINKVAGGLGGGEEQTRLQQDADWITYQFQTKGSAVRAAVIFAQAYSSSPLTSQLSAAAGAFAKPVLYIHGDGHSWTQDFPFSAPNIMRIEVNRGTASDPPVQITVTMNAANMFLINRDPWPSGTLPLNRPPCVEAGPDLQTVLANGAVLNGKATDNGVPIPSSLTVNWTQVSGPGLASFDHANAPTTTAHFSAEGSYTLQLTATDGELSTSDTVQVDAYINPPPVVTITAPASGSAYNLGQPVTLEGSAVDTPDGNLTASLSWTSNRSGFIGTGGTVSTSTLAAGVHTITASATDKGGETGSQAITVTIGAPNGPPTSTILAPGNGSSFSQGETISFNGTASDPDEGNLTASLIWTSNLDGAIGSGGAFSTSTLSAGTHIITASVTDSGGASGSAQITLAVSGPGGSVTVEVRVAASSDDAEESATGSVSLTSSDLELVTDGSIQKVGMRFNGVAVPHRAAVLNAWIQFQTKSTGSAATSLSIQGQAVDTAATFTTTAANLSSRPKTTAAAPWAPVPWNTVGAAGPDQRTPNISAVIQEIVNRAGWSSGNALAILITGTGMRTAWSYNGLPTGAPLLHVEFVPGVSGPSPDIAVVPNPEHDYGAVPVGANASRTFAINNLGSVDLQVTGTSLVGGQVAEFAIVQGGAPFTVAPGTTHNLDVRFAPTSFGVKTTTLRLTSDDPDESMLDVALSGTGTAPDVDVVPNPHNYGSVAIGTNASRTFAIRNVGNADLQVLSTSLVGGQMGEFGITLGEGSFTVVPGASHNLDVSFTPASLGPKTTMLHLTSTDPDENPVDVALTGTGVTLVPDIAVTPTPYDYGAWTIGTGVTRGFTVSNTGTGSLVVGASTLTGGDAGAFAFVSGQAGFTIAPGGSHLIEVRFSPPTQGPKSAILTIPSDDPDENPLLIPLAGAGSVGGATPPTFVEVRQGGSASASSVTTATNLTGVTGHLYLAAVSTKPYRAVNVVTGLGLTWTRVATQCAGRNQTGIELWWAQGAATTGTVTATLASAPTNAVIAVARYSGVAATNPVAPLVAGNTNGVNGGCANGTDSSAYLFNVSATQSNALVFGAVASRNNTHTPGLGYTERAEVSQGSSGNTARIAFVDRAVPVATSLSLNGSLSGAVDWAVIGIELRPGVSGP